MVFQPIVWYCRPVANGVWDRMTESSLGAYTPCGTDLVVVSVSCLVLMGMCFYRIWLIKKSLKAQRFILRSTCVQYLLLVLAGYCALQPLFRIVMDISVFNLDGQTNLAPFEVRIKVNAYSLCPGDIPNLSATYLIYMQTNLAPFECICIGVYFVVTWNA